jgi:2-methylisocitrate lyase-like PEP mutase family enzyme
VVSALAPKPVNALIGWPAELTVADLAGVGIRRISVGGALARCAWGGFMRAAKLLADEGSFAGFRDAAAGGDLNALFTPR